MKPKIIALQELSAKSWNPAIVEVESSDGAKTTYFSGKSYRMLDFDVEFCLRFIHKRGSKSDIERRRVPSLQAMYLMMEKQS